MSFQIGSKVKRIDDIRGVGEVVSVALLGDYYQVRWSDGLSPWYEDFELDFAGENDE